MLGQAVRQQKEEVRRKHQNGAANGHTAADGEDVHMRQSRGQRARKRRRGAGDVEMADAEVTISYIKYSPLDG